MKIDGSISLAISSSAAAARAAEQAGYDGAWTAETNHDPFLACVVAAEHSERLEIGTSIAVAFARNPMTMAYDTVLRSRADRLRRAGGLSGRCG